MGKVRRQSGTSWHLDNIGMPEDDESDCGFLHRNIEFEDVTTRCRTTLAGCLDNAEAAILGDGKKLNKKIKATTLRKSAVGLFTTAHEHFAVIDLHVKSFKEHGDVLARFITEAQAKLDEANDAVAARIATVFEPELTDKKVAAATGHVF